MDLDEARKFLRDHHHGVIAVLSKDGRPQMSPVLVGVDSAGRAIVSSRETALKVKSLRRHPRAWLCVLSDHFYPPWVHLEGTASIVSLPDAMEPLVDYYRRVAGEHPAWDEYRAAMEQEKRVLVRVDLERAGPDRQG